jgi:hypothetical protein
MRIGRMGAVQIKYNTSNNWEDLLDNDDNKISLKIVTDLDLDSHGFIVATYNKPVYWKYED